LGHRGRARLLFGATYEDVSIEEEAFGGRPELLALGASGDTALTLAACDRRVVAVDINPAQVDHVRDRLAGAPRRRGAADRLLATSRTMAPVAGWTRTRVERFLALTDVTVQRRVFEEFLDTARFRLLLGAGFAPSTLLRAYRPAFVDVLPPRFGAVLRDRLRRGISTHPNRANPYARLLFLGEPPAVEPPPPGRIEVHHADAVRYLESQPPGRFDGFALSNILDGPDPAFRARLAGAVRHAGAPDGDAASWAVRARSMIWGGVLVTTAARFPDHVRGLR
jgi:S-adenosylmethionine:diacylglycerol 3-amino-3-carboxypropyl transferase